MNDLPLASNGMRTLTSPYLMEDGDPVQVRRSWRERLLSRPWRPWQATRVVTTKVPYRGFVVLKSGTFVVTPGYTVHTTFSGE